MLRLENFSFDVEPILASVVALRTTIPQDAYTASRLGTERAGSGVVIGSDGLILTVGYLLTEADAVWVIDDSGRAMPAQVIGQDQESGLGLVQPLQHMHRPPLSLGKSSEITVGDSLIIASFGGADHARATRVVAKQEFAGYWEYCSTKRSSPRPPIRMDRCRRDRPRRQSDRHRLADLPAVHDGQYQHRRQSHHPDRLA
jgi:Trypsin-like serine proteases, typically periplasmic, contain C-terminal PDZ domain